MVSVKSISPRTLVRWAYSAAALGLSGFALYTAGFGVMADTIQRSVHLSLALVMVFLAPLAVGSQNRSRWAAAADILLAIIAFCTIGYQFAFYREIADRYGEILHYEVFLGIVATAVLLEATRRFVGWPMVALAVAFLAYAFLGQYLPGELAHRGYDLERIVSQVYMGADGIFGTPLGVSATFVILIVILGALLEASGASSVLMDVATGLTGQTRGGPAKAAVVGSSLMGMISGTAVANVLTVGTVSIPLMRRSGYRAEVAGAIEAVASTGGQLMPPIMGAAAFIMADLIEKPYSEIAVAAILPAILYYIAVFTAVHLEAVRIGIKPIPKDELPSVRRSLAEGGHVLLVIPIFIGMLTWGYSVMYSSLLAIIALLMLASLRRGSRLGPKAIARALASGAYAILPVALATATAGIIIAVITLTGLGLKFSSLIVTLSAGNLVLALVLTMVASLVLGMGLPTAAAYILVATLVAPALTQMGIHLLAAHMFVFYAAMLSAITPPVALAAYAAAALANANPIRIAVIAVKYGLVAFVVPYFFAFDPALLGIGSPGAIVEVAITATIGAMALAAALQGWVLIKATLIQRALLCVGAVMLMKSGLESDAAGLIAIGAVVAWQLLQRRAVVTRMLDEHA